MAQNRVAELVLETTRLKTGALTALALSFGAHLANLPVDERTLIDELGHDLGICLQMYDDLSGIVNPARAGKGAGRSVCGSTHLAVGLAFSTGGCRNV